MGLEHAQHQQRLEFLLVLVPLPETCDMQDYNYIPIEDSFWSPMFLGVCQKVFLLREGWEIVRCCDSYIYVS